MYISLASASTWFAWFLWVCSASHFVFIGSFFFFLLFFSPLFSVWGHSVRFSAAYLNSSKMQLLLPLLLFTSKQFFVFPFCCPNQHLEYQLPNERDGRQTRLSCAWARWQIWASFRAALCAFLARSLALSKLIKVWPVVSWVHGKCKSSLSIYLWSFIIILLTTRQQRA